MFNVPCVGETVAVVVLQPVGAWSDHLGHRVGSFPWWREFMFLLGRLGPSEYKIIDLEDPLPNFSFMVPAESLLVARGAKDSCLMSLFEYVTASC